MCYLQTDCKNFTDHQLLDCLALQLLSFDVVRGGGNSMVMPHTLRHGTVVLVRLMKPASCRAILLPVFDDYETAYKTTIMFYVSNVIGTLRKL